jgi:hypothetical protein
MPSSFRPLLSSAKSFFVRRPRSEFSRFIRWGPQAYFLCDAWKDQMAEVASRLPPFPQSFSSCVSGTRPIDIWFLTGNRFWYQTLFCIWTLAKHSRRHLVVNLVDDGTLHQWQEQRIRALFPVGLTRWKNDLLDQLESHLPFRRYPILRQRWLDYVNIRKLTDVHLGGVGHRLVLDSDMLFFAYPGELLSWWDDPSGACLMSDCQESYGYSKGLMAQLAHADIPPLLNVGICGLRSEDLDWDELEHWCRTLAELEGTSYYLEQALVAMLAARMPRHVMPAARYITFPSREQAFRGEGVLQHYVSDSKPFYFRKCWRLSIDQ